MSSKEVVMHTLKDDKQELQKQLGCMNGIFQIFDRRYLLGQRRHNQKRLPPGESDNGEQESKKTSEKTKEKSPKVVTKEKKKVSIELPRNSFSSSSSSTAMSSSLDCSKRVQTELSSSCQSVISEPSSSPISHRKKPDLFIQSPDIRDVVKESMTREPRVVTIKTAAKDERVGPVMKHIDSPRPFPQQKPVIQYDLCNRNVVKLREISWGVEKVKETSRFSCDGRESRLKNNMKVKELPRLSLDSRQGYFSNSANDPTSNKRSSSSVVARLMGLEALTSTIDETIDEKKTTKTESEDLVLNSRLNKKEELKQGHFPDTQRACKDSASPKRGVKVKVKVNHVITRIPLETAPWKQEGRGQGLHKPPFKSKEVGSPRTEPVSRSVYGEIEKRLTQHEFKTAGKDLRALKQILEAMQKTKNRLENKEDGFDSSSIDGMLSQKVDQPVSPKVNAISPRKVKHADVKKDSVGRQRLKEVKEPSFRDRKSTGRPQSPSNFLEYSGPGSPKMQRSKNGIHGPSFDSSRPKKQHGIQRAVFGSTTRNPKAKSMDLPQDSSETRNLSQLSDTISYQSENDSELTSTEWVQEVNSPFRPKEHHRKNESNIVERLIEEKSTVDHAKHTMEQPSPVSVLDAFYTEDTPSPVKTKSNAFNDDDNLHFEEVKDQEKMNNIHQYSEFNNMKLENIKILVQQIELLNTNTDDEIGDHEYIEEILLASGCLKDLNRTTTIIQLQLHPTVGLINPDLFHVLEKTKGYTENSYHKKNTRPNIRRKLVFDTVNDVLCHKLATLGPFGPHKSRNLNKKKLMKELCLEINGLQNNSEKGVYDEDDEVLNIINADVNKRSQDWDEYCYQVPGLVLDIERMIFKDLINEVVNGQESDVQDWAVRRRCRQLFPM